MPFIAGIEEAGRGPVIGPMVMAIAVIEPERGPYLREIGVRDSKELSPGKRNDLFKQLCEILVMYKFIIILPREIDNALITGGNNLNRLEADITIKLIKSVRQHIQISQYFIDCPSTNIKSYVNYLQSRLNIKSTCLIAEHKADKNYPIVGAASIIAKVIRDQEIEKLHTTYDINCGSGYPSDPVTVDFLWQWIKKNKNWPDFVRKSWETAKNLLKKKNQRKLDEFFR